MTILKILKNNNSALEYKNIEELEFPYYAIEKLEIVETQQRTRLKAILIDNIFTFLSDSYMNGITPTLDILTELNRQHLLLLVFEEIGGMYSNLKSSNNFTHLFIYSLHLF